MTSRDTEFQAFLDAAQGAFDAAAEDSRSRASLGRIFAALATPASPRDAAPPASLPALAHLAEAVRPERFDDPGLARLAQAFLALAPRLPWRPRGGIDPSLGSDEPGEGSASANFRQGHANGMIAGPGGLEPRTDLWLGVSLLAPHVRYPDHNHRPEETYLVLTDGEFRQDDGPWFRPGVGGSFYNEPDIRHAMRSGDVPLLAFWALWTGPADTGPNGRTGH